MSGDGKIIALFGSGEEESRCNDLVRGIPGLIRMVASGSLPITLAELKRGGCNPRVFIIPAQLYPYARPDLARMLRSIFPTTEMILVSGVDDPFPPLNLLAADRVRHLAVDPRGDCRSFGMQFRTAVSILAEGRQWAVADHVATGTEIHQFPIVSSSQKEEIIRSLEAAITGDSEEIEILRQKGALLADELLENALYGAPQDGGTKLYRKGTDRPVLQKEGIVFRYAFDGETLAMEVADGWGSLSPDLVMEYLAMNQGECRESDGGGRGFFIIWRFLDQFHVSIKPGEQTVVGGHIRVSSSFDPEAPKGFQISALG